jgi:O-antigen/teichoic acid export membrane protein
MNMPGNSVMKGLAGEAFWVAFGAALSTLAGFVGVRLLTGVMVPEEYGKLGLAMSLAMSLRYSLGAMFRTGTARFYSVARDSASFVWYWRLLRKISVLVCVGNLLAGALLFIVFYAAGQSENAWMISLSVLTGGLIVISGIGTGIQSGARNRKAVCWNQNLFNWGRFAFAFVLAVLFSGSALSALVGFLAAILLTLVSQYLFVRKELFPLMRSEGPVGKGHSTGFFAYLWPLLISGVFIWIQLFSIRWAIRQFGSLADVGSYFAYYQIGFMPALVGSGFLITFLNPIFFSHVGDGSDQKAQRKVRVINGRISVVMLAIVLAGFATVLALQSVLAQILVSPAYRADGWMLPWLVLSGGLYAVARQFLLSIYSGMDSKKMLSVSITGGVLALVLNLAGGWFGGVPGILFGGVCFSLIFVFLTWRLHARELRAGHITSGEGLRDDTASFC